MGTAGAAAYACPVITSSGGEPVATEIRAYKLGKKRWSYNQIELSLGEAGSERQAGVKQTTFQADFQFPAPQQDSAVCFNLQLQSGHRLQAHLFLVYGNAADEASGDAASEAAAGAPAARNATACSSSSNGSSGSGSGGRSCTVAEAAAQPPAGAEDGTGGHCWTMVTRADCCKGCKGCILRPIQRFGRMGKRSWSDEGDAAAAAGAAAGATGEGPTPSSPGATDAGCPAGQPAPPASMKDPKFMYVSIDEACTHVGAPAFRLVAGIYDASGDRLLATAVSPLIRVLANNDVPTGAARITLEAQLPPDWEGWAAGVEPGAEEGAPAGRTARPRAPRRARKTAKKATAPAPASAPAQPTAAAVPGGSAGVSTQPQGVEPGSGGALTVTDGGAGSPAAGTGMTAAGAEPWDSCQLGALGPPTPAAPASCLHPREHSGSLAPVPPQHSTAPLLTPSTSRSAVWSEQHVVTTPVPAAKRAAIGTGPNPGASVRTLLVPVPAAATAAAHAPLSLWQRQPQAPPASACGRCASAASPNCSTLHAFSSAAEHDGRAAAAVAAWAAQKQQQQWQQQQQAPQQLQHQQQQGPSVSHAASLSPDGGPPPGSLPGQPPPMGAWEDQRLRLAAAVQQHQQQQWQQQQWQQWQQLQQQQGQQQWWVSSPLPSPTDSDASAALCFHTAGAAPPATPGGLSGGGAGRQAQFMGPGKMHIYVAHSPGDGSGSGVLPGAGCAAHATGAPRGSSPHEASPSCVGQPVGSAGVGAERAQAPVAGRVAHALSAEAAAARGPLREALLRYSDSQLHAASQAASSRASLFAAALQLPQQLQQGQTQAFATHSADAMHAIRGAHSSAPAPAYALHAAAGAAGRAGYGDLCGGAPSSSSLEDLCRVPNLSRHGPSPHLGLGLVGSTSTHLGLSPSTSTYLGLAGSTSAHLGLAGSTSAHLGLGLAGSTSGHLGLAGSTSLLADPLPRDDSLPPLFDGGASIFADVPDAPFY